MTERRARRPVLRLELAACALGATVLLTTLVVSIDVLRFHRSTTAIPVVLVGGAALALMGGSLARQVLRQRAFLARLPRRPGTILGRPVQVIPSARPHAFCAGFLRPCVIVSEGLLERLSERELRSVLAHESHHARRRDPLRRALVQATCDGFWFIPGMRATAVTYARISELAADAFAIRNAGAEPLASALRHFEAEGDGAKAERARRLGGAAPRAAGTLATAGAAAVLLALAGAALYLLRPVPAELCLPASPLAVAALALACVPAGLLTHRAASAL